MLPFFIFACVVQEDNNEISLAKQYLEEFSDFETWEQVSQWNGVQPSQAAHGTYVQIWLNDVAMMSLEYGEEYRYGSAIIKEGYLDEEGTQRKALTVMIKRKDFAPDTGDWFWAVYSDTDEVLLAGIPDYCISCHEASSDYVLFLEDE
ncbi:MAG: hypothetical protein CL916_10870 [Deltaproteobacteria bacterium]|nr:hypothetical protein [Deltaproteobacteria bacterium]